MPKSALRLELGKWYVAVELYAHSPDRYFYGAAFKPYVRWCCCKIIDYGDLETGGDREMVKVGGWGQLSLPWGIEVTII